MKINTTINKKTVSIWLNFPKPKPGEEIKLSVTRVQWEGKEEKKIELENDLLELLEYINSAEFTLPSLEIK